MTLVIVNVLIGFIQEGEVEKAMDAIRKMLALKASVLRDGERRAVEGEKLVPSDIV
jgi:pentatricopeptide repeat protein